MQKDFPKYRFLIAFKHSFIHLMFILKTIKINFNFPSPLLGANESERERKRDMGVCLHMTSRCEKLNSVKLILPRNLTLSFNLPDYACCQTSPSLSAPGAVISNEDFNS